MSRIEKKGISGYVGWFKQPLEQPHVSSPTMYMVADHKKREMDLVLLTPGCFLDAYHHIKRFQAIKTKLFIPSLQIEWVSDMFNLYMEARFINDIQWVFPNRTDHDTFEKGHLLEMYHQNEFDSHYGVQYIKNPEVDNVYDIQVYDRDGIHYFSQYLTNEILSEILQNNDVVDVHIPYSSTLYGGLNYLLAYQSNPGLTRKKLVPHSFMSIAEYELFHELKNANAGKVYTWEV